MSSSTTSLSSFLPPVPSNALLYQQARINPIGVTAATSVNIGYLNQNKTQLEVVGELTGQDPVDMYNFTFQQGSQISLKLTNINETTSVHVQLFDGSGTRVIADNQGNSTTLAAWKQLTSSGGISAKPGKYIVKVTYGNGVSKSQKQDYALQIGSGTTFNADYRTLASATTINNTLLAGGSIGYNPLTTTASLLTALSGGSNTPINIFTSGILG